MDKIANPTFFVTISPLFDNNKRVFSGYEPEFNYSFVGDLEHNYKTKGCFDRNRLVASINSQQKQQAGWYFSEELAYEAGSHDHSLVFSLQLNKNW